MVGVERGMTFEFTRESGGHLQGGWAPAVTATRQRMGTSRMATSLGMDRSNRKHRGTGRSELRMERRGLADCAEFRTAQNSERRRIPEGAKARSETTTQRRPHPRTNSLPTSVYADRAGRGYATLSPSSRSPR